MDLDRINIALRPRSDWEAVDLGLRLAQRHAGLVFPVWFAASAPWAALIGGLCIALGNVGLAILLLWWIKPLFERVLLHLYGRLIFDDRPTPGELRRIVWRQPFTAGWVRALTYRRLELARSFNLPVWQLEMLRGEARRRRTSVLHLGSGGTAVVLSVASLALVALFFTTATLLVVSFMVREIIIVDLYSLVGFVGEMLERLDEPSVLRDTTGFLLYWLCEGVVAPFYVGAGFSLYLNRRTKLEAWDIEMQFRRALRRRGVAAAVVVACLGLSMMSPVIDSTALAAEPAPASERERISRQIEAIVADDDFGRWKTRTRWVPKNRVDEQADDVTPPTPDASAHWLGSLLGSLTEVVLWSVVILGLGMLVAFRDRWLKYFAGTLTPITHGPRVSGGVLLSAEEVPEDIPAQVLAMWHAGRAIEAAGLLYRATLTILDERHDLRIVDGATEGDCVKRVRARLNADIAAFFARIADTWQQVAYAHLLPSQLEVAALCEEWPARMAVSR